MTRPDISRDLANRAVRTNEEVEGDRRVVSTLELRAAVRTLEQDHFADLIMADGRSLEKIGVTPDEKIVPSALDLAADRDVPLARAAELLGFKMTPEEAGKLFPNEYRSR